MTGLWRRFSRLFGIALVVVGVVMVAKPLYDLWQRHNADNQAIDAWLHNGSNALQGPGSFLPDPSNPAANGCNPNNIPAADYAFVSFSSLPKYAYTGVAGNGDWSLLHDRSMVHWHDSPAPGQKGNVIIAFHREPSYEHIDQLNVNDVVQVQDRQCKTYSYKITNRWTESPNNVTQLTSTSDNNLTLITCTPWWQDYNRIVWRGVEVTS